MTPWDLQAADTCFHCANPTTPKTVPTPNPETLERCAEVGIPLNVINTTLILGLGNQYWSPGIGAQCHRYTYLSRGLASSHVLTPFLTVSLLPKSTRRRWISPFTALRDMRWRDTAIETVEKSQTLWPGCTFPSLSINLSIYYYPTSITTERVTELGEVQVVSLTLLSSHCYWFCKSTGQRPYNL